MRVSQRAPRTHRNKWIFLRTVSLAEAWRGAQRHARGWRARSHFQGRVRVPFALLKGVRIARRDASAVERRREDRFRLRKDPLDRPVRVRSTLRFERRRERRVGRFSGSGCVGRDVGSRGGAHRALRARNRGQDQRGRVFFARKDPRGRGGFGQPERIGGWPPRRARGRCAWRRARFRASPPRAPRRGPSDHDEFAPNTRPKPRAEVVAAAVSVPSVQTVEDNSATARTVWWMAKTRKQKTGAPRRAPRGPAGCRAPGGRAAGLASDQVTRVPASYSRRGNDGRGGREG